MNTFWMFAGIVTGTNVALVLTARKLQKDAQEIVKTALLLKKELVALLAAHAEREGKSGIAGAADMARRFLG